MRFWVEATAAGILEREPREAECAANPVAKSFVVGLTADVDLLLKAGEVEKALDMVDRQVLVDGLGWSPHVVNECRRPGGTLRDRRTTQGRG
jgi:adenine-specific DNA methylase